MRISESQLQGIMFSGIEKSREKIAQYSEELTTGLKAAMPGDTNSAASITLFQDQLERLAGYEERIKVAEGFLTFQDDVMLQAQEVLLRAKEIAEQGANESNGQVERAHLAEEIFQLRDHLVSLANSKYLGKYVWGAGDDDDPPYDRVADYTNSSGGADAVRYQFDAEAGTELSRTVRITDDLTIVTNRAAQGTGTAGDPRTQIFDDGLYALERLGRSLKGYATEVNSDIDAGAADAIAQTQPTGAGAAYVFPADYQQQSIDIRATIDDLQTAIDSDFMPERVALGGKLRRLQTAGSLIELNRGKAEEVITKLQAADVFESASLMTEAQTSLDAALTVTVRALNLSILDYI